MQIKLNIRHRQSRYTGRGYFSGEGSGIVTIAGTPARRRIFVFDEQTMMCVRDVYSHEDGTYRVDNLDETRTYILMGYDNLRQYNKIDGWAGMKPKVN